MKAPNEIVELLIAKANTKGPQAQLDLILLKDVVHPLIFDFARSLKDHEIPLVREAARDLMEHLNQQLQEAGPSLPVTESDPSNSVDSARDQQSDAPGSRNVLLIAIALGIVLTGTFALHSKGR